MNLNYTKMEVIAEKIGKLEVRVTEVKTGLERIAKADLSETILEKRFNYNMELRKIEIGLKFLNQSNNKSIDYFEDLKNESLRLKNESKLYLDKYDYNKNFTDEDIMEFAKHTDVEEVERYKYNLLLEILRELRREDATGSKN